MATVTGQVESYFRTIIATLQPGQRLPSERHVVTELGTCRSTVRLVLTQLKGEGLIRAVQGSGYYTTLR